MADDVVLNKAAIIERCLKRIEEEYIGHEETLESSQTRQDSIILNLQRACEAAIDLAMHIISDKGLGVPQESREAFILLEKAGIIKPSLSKQLQAMVGFRNIAVHNYQQISMDILRAILEKHLGDFRKFISILLKK